MVYRPLDIIETFLQSDKKGEVTPSRRTSPRIRAILIDLII